MTPHCTKLDTIRSDLKQDSEKIWLVETDWIQYEEYDKGIKHVNVDNIEYDIMQDMNEMKLHFQYKSYEYECESQFASKNVKILGIKRNCYKSYDFLQINYLLWYIQYVIGTDLATAGKSEE